MRPYVLFAVALVFMMSAPAGLCPGAEAKARPWRMPEVPAIVRGSAPVLACTPGELARLRAALRGPAEDRRVVLAMTRQADAACKAPLTFPSRGGQHNQWYQCDRCQIALKTVDEAHHKCPKCNRVYTGEPYDDVVFSRRHWANLRGMHAAAWAWALTGRRQYADHAAKVLSGYARRYKGYPYHSASRSTKGRGGRSGGHLFEQTLTEASAMASYIAPAFDLVYGSPALSDADRQAIRTGLFEPMLANIAGNGAGKSNWQTWHNAAMLWGGAVIGRADWVRRALADPNNGFACQMRISVTPEGMWYENSWGYHFYTLRAMVLLAEGSRRLGVDLWRHPALAKMCTIAVDYAMPDGSLPRFGDDVNTRVSSASAYLEYLYHARGDPAVAVWLPRRATWNSIMLGRRIENPPPPPAPRSVAFAGAGHAILRAGGPAAPAAVMTFGPYGGFHGHYDKLSFVYFAFGRELGVDPGRARSQAYRLPIHRQWYKATLSHNTVLVDGASQKPAAGKLELFAANAQAAVAVARCDAAYPGLRHRRMLCLLPQYLLVCDELAPAPARGKRPAAKPHRFDWVYHNHAKAAVSPDARQPAEAPPEIAGREYLRNVRIGRTDRTVRVAFEGPKVSTHLTLAAAVGTEVYVGDGVGGSVVDRVPVAFVRRVGPAIHYVAVLEPVRASSKPTVRDVSCRRTGSGACEVTVRRDGGTDVVTLTPGAEVSVRRDGRIVLAGKRDAAP